MMWQLVVFVTVAVIIDLVLGYIKAWKNNDVSSAKMREGVIHKFTYFVEIGLCLILDYAAQYMDIGVSVANGFYIVVVAWIFLTEVTSIIENLIAINPKLEESPLAHFFAKKED